MNDTNKRIKVILFVIIGLFSLVFYKLYDLQIVKQKEYETLAYKQQIYENEKKASRGNIYDRNLVTLASSEKDYTVTISPAEMQDEKELEKVAKFLSKLLSVSYDEIIEKGQNKNSYYRVIATKVSAEKADEIRVFLKENKLNTINLEQTTSRVYPYGSLASTVIGFTGNEGSGAYGLESYYEKVLAGTSASGYRITDGLLGDMPDSEKEEYDAVNGKSLVLTLDAFVQESLEKHLQTAVEEYDVQNRAVGIVMNAKTGAILAMASMPDFDPNYPQKVADETLTGTDKRDAQFAQWRNKAISDAYEPGSIFKLITGACALESSSTEATGINYYCNGYYDVEGHLKACWNTNGHGVIDFTHAIMYSCNPSFMQIAEQIGPEKFQEYFERFNLRNPTGIDLPGEGTGVFYSDLVESNKESAEYLASSSFGQSFTVTPIEMITAVSAVVNGGNLVTPYIVDKVIDENGNIVSQTVPQIVRQVISKETSEKMCEIMEQVVASGDGTGKKAYIPGYRIGGKTGTSEKLNTISEDGEHEEYVVSFLSAFPIDNPELVMLITLDEPQIGNIQGSVIAAPVCNAVMGEILPYLGYEKNLSEEENQNQEVYIPTCENQIFHDAVSACTAKQLKYEKIGTGTVVRYQRPTAGYPIPKGNTIYLYMDETEPLLNEVPDVIGLTASQAETKLKANRYNVRIKGEGQTVISQSPLPGETYEAGIITTIYLE